MKRIIFTAVCVLTTLAMAAQTYNNGVWYSLYDQPSDQTNGYKNSDKTFDVFAPTAQTCSFEWKKTGQFVGYPIYTLKMSESTDGSKFLNEKKVVDSGATEKKDSWQNGSTSVSKDIVKVKFSQTGTLNRHYKNVTIPLAQHILLASGTYGTTSATKDFGEVEALTVVEAYTVNLRSFLTAGDITVSSSNPAIFHVGAADNQDAIVYAVGANACASANGSAAEAGGGTLGNISNYAFQVYFTPQEAVDYSATITITDGTSTATVTVSGKGTKKNQSISWEQEEVILTTGTIAAAAASSELPVSYTITPENIVAYADGAFAVVGEGVVTITATQAGNSVFAPAEAVTKTILVYPAVTRETYSGVLCEGETYNDEHFAELSVTELYYDTIRNVYGGDSILCLDLLVYPVFGEEDSLTIVVGAEEFWQDIDLSILPIGDTTLVAEYTTINGCDSTYTLYLSVTEAITTGIPTMNVGEQVSKVILNGRIYLRKGDEWYDALGRKIAAVKKD